jgi:hypothetical protein
MRHFIFIFSAAMILISCGQKDKKQTDQGQGGNDTAQNKTATIDSVSKTNEPGKTDSISNPVNDGKLITGKEAGPFKMGSSLAEIQKAVQAPYTLGKAVDGFEGDKYYTLSQGKDKILRVLVYTDHVTEIMVYDKSFHTSDNVQIGTLLADAEKKYGKIKSLDIDEQEDFEYTSFEKLRGVDFIISVNNKGAKAGVYGKDQFSTTKYDPSAFVSMIRIRGGE